VAEEDDEASYYHSHNQKPLLRHGSGDGRVELMMEGGGNMATNNDSSLSASFYNTRATTAVEEDTAECDAFGRLVANKMLKLSSPEKDEAQTRVLQVFAEIKSRRHYNNDFGNHNHDHE
jgi:hypothetical protein